MNNKKGNFVMTSRHDFFGDVAETFVKYSFACEGFEVFGSGHWAADVVIRNKDNDDWFRVEVKSTDRQRQPSHKSYEELSKNAELLAEVTLVPKNQNQLCLKLTKLSKRVRRESCRIEIEKEGDIRNFLYHT